MRWSPAGNCCRNLILPTQSRSIRREGDGENDIPVAIENCQALAAGNIPKSHVLGGARGRASRTTGKYNHKVTHGLLGPLRRQFQTSEPGAWRPSIVVLERNRDIHRGSRADDFLIVAVIEVDDALPRGEPSPDSFPQPNVVPAFIVTAV